MLDATNISARGCVLHTRLKYLQACSKDFITIQTLENRNAIRCNLDPGPRGFR